MSFGKKVKIYNYYIAANNEHFLLDKYSISKLCGITTDYSNQLLNGSKQPTEKILKIISETTKIEKRIWQSEVDSFGRSLGIGNEQINKLIGIQSRGILFDSELNDDIQILDIFKLTQGYYFSYYYSVSNFEKKMVSRDVFQVMEIGYSGKIKVKLADGYFNYVGNCVPIKNHLYYFLEKEEGLDEIVVYCTNHPNMQNRDLYGIILCSSSKSKKRQHTYSPAASKVYFKYLGRTVEDVSKSLGVTIESFDDLKKMYANYIDENDPDSFGPTSLEDLVNIDNTILPSRIPFSLISDD